MIRVLMSFLIIESKILLQKPSKLIFPGVFYLIILSVLPFSISSELLSNKHIVVAFLTISILFVVHVNYSQTFNEDIKSGFLEQVIMSGYSLTSFVLSKIIFNTFLVFISIVVTFPILILFYDFPKEIFFSFLLLSLMLCLSLITIINFSSALTMGIKNGLIITLILSFPLSLSVLIDFSLVSTELVINGFIKEKSWILWIMFGKILTILPIAVYLSTISIIDAVNNFK